MARVLFSAAGRKLHAADLDAVEITNSEFAKFRQPFGQRPERCTPAASRKESSIPFAQKVRDREYLRIHPVAAATARNPSSMSLVVLASASPSCLVVV